jgi:hypothetical protein
MRLIRASLAAATVALAASAAAAATTFTNPAPILVPSPDTGINPEPALLYPSPIVVSGMAGQISLVSVTVNSLSHTFPDDLDFLLVGPGGQKFHFWSDVGGGTTISNATITVSDSGATTLPDAGPLLNGTTYRPFNASTTGDTMPAPAPAAPYSEPTTIGAATFGSVFGGLGGASMNGTWNLYMTDDIDGEVGGAGGGWTLNITTNPTAVTVASTAATRTACGVVVRWRTATETGVLGFRVHRQVLGRRVPVSAHLLPQASFAGSSYVSLDRKAPVRGRLTYWIEAVQLDGTSAWFGPIATR